MITDNIALSLRAFIVTPANYIETNLSSTKTNNVTVHWDHSTQAFLFSEEVTNAIIYNVTRELFKSGKTSLLSAATMPSGDYIIRTNRSNSCGSQILKVIRP